MNKQPVTKPQKPLSNTKEIAELNRELAFAACSVFGGKIYVMGGKDGRLGSSASVAIYDNLKDKKKTYDRSSMCYPREELKSVKNKLHLVGLI